MRCLGFPSIPAWTLHRARSLEQVEVPMFQFVSMKALGVTCALVFALAVAQIASADSTKIAGLISKALLVDRLQQETVHPAPKDRPEGAFQLEGKPIAPGLAMDRVFFLRRDRVEEPDYAARGTPEEEVAHLERAIEASEREILGLIEEVAGRGFPRLASVYSEYLPTLDLEQRHDFASRLADAGDIDTAGLLSEFRPYLSRQEVLELVTAGFEIGNHTLSHTHLRSLTPEQCRLEIDGNKQRLEAMTGLDVRTFSYPYGANEDSNGTAIDAIKRSEHETAFLVEGRLNTASSDPYQYTRVSLKDFSDAGIFTELELLTRLREYRERFR